MANFILLLVYRWVYLSRLLLFNCMGILCCFKFRIPDHSVWIASEHKENFETAGAKKFEFMHGLESHICIFDIYWTLSSPVCDVGRNPID
jgi:hypothetical protein